MKFSVRGRDLTSTITEAQAKIAQKVHLPYDLHLEWGGEFNELNEAMSRLKIIIPITLLLITFLVYTAVKTWTDTAIVLVSIPVACTGGVFALIVTGVNFSVSAAIISIFGIAIQDAILVVTYFRRSRYVEGLSVEDAARDAGEKRFRAALMTTLVATIGLLLAALSNGIGSHTPLAIVVIGGSLVLALLSRIRQPPLLILAHNWLDRRATRKPSEQALPSNQEAL